MPTLPLFRTPADGAPPHASHAVTAPGGYEWWRLEAADDAQAIHVQADVFVGDPFDRAYRRAYARYRRRPTRVPPPVPRGFSAVRVLVVRGGDQVFAKDCGAWARAQTRVSANGDEIDVGDDCLRLGRDGSLTFTTSNDAGSIELTFRPRAPRAGAITLRELASDDRAVRHWQVDDQGQAFDVSGVVREPQRAEPGASLTIAGSGAIAHRFGTGPMSRGMIRELRVGTAARGAVNVAGLGGVGGGGR